MKEATLCFVISEGKILLGFKKKGFGSLKYAGFGGKLENGETPEQAAVRELQEECGVLVSLEDLKNAGKIDFLFPFKQEWDMIVHVFVAKKWSGEPSETDEMRPQWFEISNIPYGSMWDDYKHWLPRILNGERVEATFHFKEDNEHVADFTLAEHNV
jgi:mutator protein MutT